MNLLENKNILIMGIRNKWSLAWGIARMADANGANIILTYRGERDLKHVTKLVEQLHNGAIFTCDVTKDEDLVKLTDYIKEHKLIIHGFVHCIAHALVHEMTTPFIETSRAGFMHALDASVYSLIAVSRIIKNFMPEGGAILALTFIGGEKVFPGYNIMGVAKAALESSVKYLAYDLGSMQIRVNAISAGPIKTIATTGIKGFQHLLDTAVQRSPLKNNITQDDVGKTAIFLLSELALNITGEIMHVDCGYNIMGI